MGLFSKIKNIISNKSKEVETVSEEEKETINKYDEGLEKTR